MQQSTSGSTIRPGRRSRSRPSAVTDAYRSPTAGAKALPPPDGRPPHRLAVPHEGHLHPIGRGEGALHAVRVRAKAPLTKGEKSARAQAVQKRVDQPMCEILWTAFDETEVRPDHRRIHQRTGRRDDHGVDVEVVAQLATCDRTAEHSPHVVPPWLDDGLGEFLREIGMPPTLGNEAGIELPCSCRLL